MATVLAVSNQKGGVGKTTSAIHIAAALSLAGQRTLLIDLDSQANATTGLGVAEASDERPGSYDAFVKQSGVRAAWAQKTALPDLWVLAASLELAGIDLELSGQDNAVERLKSALTGIDEDFTWIVIDCPPSLGFLSVNALVAADHVVTPLPPERFAIDGLERLRGTMNRLRESNRITASDPSILLTRTQSWSDSHRARMIELRNTYGPQVLVAEVPLSPGLEEASDRRRAIFLDIPQSTGGDAYMAATAEMMLTLQRQRIDTKSVNGLVARMKSALVAILPEPAPEHVPDVALPLKTHDTWFGRSMIAIRYGRHRRLAMLGSVVVLIAALYAISLIA